MSVPASSGNLEAKIGANGQNRWHRRLRHSLKWRLVALFLLLALGVSVVFLHGMQKGLGQGWRDAVKPLLSDYVDRLVAQMGTPPDPTVAKAMAAKLPISVRIDGPKVQFNSHPRPQHDHWQRGEFGRDTENSGLLQRQTSDGHTVTFGLGDLNWRRGPGSVVWITLTGLLGLTILAYLFVRRMLKPLDDIGAGARRFGAGDFATPIAQRRRDELGDLAGQINNMGQSLHHMLEAKRTLLLAISHELRSPLTRARLNIELLPETGATQVPREALKRDVAEMAGLISDLLESERLSSRHAALHLELTDLAAVVQEVVAQMDLGAGAGNLSDGIAIAQTEPSPPVPTAPLLNIAADLPPMSLDQSRMRLLLRNLIDNALRFSPSGGPACEVSLQRDGRQLVLSVRDFGPGVDEADLAQLGEPFFRPDTSRQRSTGGVGLGLHLCKLVAQAHGGMLGFRNAAPGLEARVVLPLA